MKKLLTIFIIAYSANVAAQDVKKDATSKQTKIETFFSKTGVKTKFTDFNLDNLKCQFAVAATRIRKVSIGGGDATYFYQIEKAGDYGAVASIEYSDLLEVIKALQSLKAEADGDVASNPDYLENMFVTVDGFQVGYYVSKGRLSWCIKLEKYGSNNTLYLKAREDAEVAFTAARDKIDELSKK